MSLIDSVNQVVRPLRESPESLANRGYVNVMDENAVFPTICSLCGRPSSFLNPLRLEPCGTMREMARRYMHRSVGVCCSR